MSSKSGHIEYWRKKLAEKPPALELPLRSMALGRTFSPEWLPFPATAALDAFTASVAERDFTPAEGMLALYVAVLHRTTRQANIVLGAHVEGSFGTLRFDFDGKETFEDLLKRAQEELFAVRERPVKLAELVRAAGAAQVADLVSVLVTIGPSPPDVRERLDLVLSLSNERIEAVDPDAAPVELIFDAGRFDAAVPRRMLGHVATLMAAATKAPETPLGMLPLLTEDERRQILDDWNKKQIDFPRDVCLHELFEQAVDRDPHAVACVLGDERLTYGELDTRANQLARHLRELGVGPDVLVGISCDRSFEMVIGLMGIAKAGGAYLPMDPSYPGERLRFMAKDSGLGVLLTQKHLRGLLSKGKRVRVLLDAERETLDAYPGERLEPSDKSAQPESLAYCIYTSGSTGKPKGVLLDHRGRVNNFLDFNRRFDVEQGDALIALASLSFDMCAYDVFGTLAAGATIVLPRPDEMKDPVAWARAMRAAKVTTWHTAPAMLKMLVEHLEASPEETPQDLRLVLLGGDWIPVDLPDRLRALPGLARTRVISMGGATECSMDSTIYEVRRTDPAWNSIPYGEPMANQLAYVLDDNLQPVPIGVAGELFLGGVGVGRGYLNRPELTAERFLENPFTDREDAKDSTGAARMYRTGDLARWMPDGNLELLGRLDNQVKIRGLRIELGEIEARLRSHPAVSEGVVVAQPDASGERRLVAYYVQDPEWDGAEDGNDPGVEQIQQWQVVYDSIYASSRADEIEDPTFNITSWDSSYTAEPIPAEEMREWVDCTVDRILAASPSRVLEIGCGMGLLLFRVAPSCESYVGLDFSKVALDWVRKHADERGLSQVELKQCMAHELDGFKDDSFDTIVLNSIIFDFPSMDYLTDVLERAVRLVRPGGSIFVGDVRSRPLLAAFQASVHLFKAADDQPTEQLADRVTRAARNEEELVIDPEYFHWLKTRIPALGGVEVQLKRGRHVNEMSAYRYDARLFVGPVAKPVAFQKTMRKVKGLESVEAELRKGPASLLAKGVPNRRVERDLAALDCLADPKKHADAAAVRAATPTTEMAIDPEDLWALADELEYTAEIRWSATDPSCFDVAFRKEPPSRGSLFLDSPLDATAAAQAEGPADFGNNPMLAKLAHKLGQKLRAFLGADLPDYMVPALFMAMDEMPLSPNGKVDRKRLPEPDTSRPEMHSTYEAPTGALQEVVCSIWEEVLGMDRIGANDAFLELGGHSILAVQIQARINEIFPLDLPLRAIFEADTPAQLADHMRSEGKTAGIDVDELAELIQMVEGLSGDEVTKRLAQLAKGA